MLRTNEETEASINFNGGGTDMKIVVLDGYTENPGDLSWGGLEALGELKVYDRTPLDNEAEIIRRIGDAEVVLTDRKSTRLNSSH